MTLIELPFGLPGRVFRSEMPFSSYDPNGELLLDYQREHLTSIVLLAEDAECRQITGFDLRNYYIEKGFIVIHLPVPDFGTPKIEDITEAVKLSNEQSLHGYHQVVHCHVGIGRTGMFIACLAIQNLGLPWKDAISWVRGLIPGAVETSEQVQLINVFSEGETSC
jgi:protein-tyrosine phosphatase